MNRMLKTSTGARGLRKLPMKRKSLNSSLAAALFLAVSVSGVPAQTTTVQPVEGPGGQLLPSASGILNPHVTEGRFGTSLQGGYFMPKSQNSEESRFSSNALLGPSGEFIGMRSDLDAARDFPQRQQGDENELSEVDRLLVMRHMRRQAAVQQAAEETLTQRSAAPYSGPLPYTTPEPAALAEPAQTAETLPPPPPVAEPVQQPSPPQPSEEIWMRGSSRLAAPSLTSRGGNPPNSNTELMIDPRWFEFSGGADIQAPAATEAGENVSFPAPAESSKPFGPPEEGMVVGSLLSEDPSAPAQALPSDLLARNGRQERQSTAAFQQRLETLLLQSPLVSPLAPIHVKLNGSSAVLSGVVGSETARVEAGKILLDNGVETVDNRIVVYSDNTAGSTGQNGPSENPAPFEIEENGAGDLVPADSASAPESGTAE